MARASVVLSLLGSLGAFVAFWVFYFSTLNSWCWMWCGSRNGMGVGAGLAFVLGLFGAYLARDRMPAAPLVLLAAAGVGFIDGDVRYLIVTVVFLLAALVAWTSLYGNAADRSRAAPRRKGNG